MVVFLDKRCGKYGKEKFQSGPDNGFQQMPATHLAVREAHGGMDVDLRCIVRQAEVADE